jgi:hypothetical protein
MVYLYSLRVHLTLPFRKQKLQFYTKLQKMDSFGLLFQIIVIYNVESLCFQITGNELFF